ncbi:hypothetical protein F2P56_030875, partial [Juglans regia]
MLFKFRYVANLSDSGTLRTLNFADKVGLGFCNARFCSAFRSIYPMIRTKKKPKIRERRSRFVYLWIYVDCRSTHLFVVPVRCIILQPLVVGLHSIKVYRTELPCNILCSAATRLIHQIEGLQI